jgi:LysR family transcriptional regulator, hca operon transcriptional activator
VVLPGNHRLAALKAISPQDLFGETFVTVSHTAPVLRQIIDNYLKRSGIKITPAHEADHVTMGISLIASTGGVGLLPAYAENFLPSSVTSRPLKGDAPTVELVLGYKKSNQSPILKLLLSRLKELVARVSRRRPDKTPGMLEALIWKVMREWPPRTPLMKGQSDVVSGVG